MTQNHILFEAKEGVGVLTLNRPESLNTLSLDANGYGSGHCWTVKRFARASRRFYRSAHRASTEARNELPNH